MKGPDAAYAIRDFQRLMQLIPRWAGERSPSVSIDEVYKIILFSFAFFGHALSSAAMHKREIERFVASGAVEISREFSKPLAVVQDDLDRVFENSQG
jgi:hypothetical protein